MMTSRGMLAMLWAVTAWLALSVGPTAAQATCAAPLTNGTVPTSADCRFIYAWTSDGGTFQRVDEFLAGLNNRFAPDGCFADHCDWRMPTVAGIQYDTGDEAELESIHASVPDCGSTTEQACILSVFGPTLADEYWSSSVPRDRDDGRWVMRFDVDAVTSRLTVLPSTAGALVRAVRDF